MSDSFLQRYRVDLITAVQNSIIVVVRLQNLVIPCLKLGVKIFVSQLQASLNLSDLLVIHCAIAVNDYSFKVLFVIIEVQMVRLRLLEANFAVPSDVKLGCNAFPVWVRCPMVSVYFVPSAKEPFQVKVIDCLDFGTPSAKRTTFCSLDDNE